jgi:hypothetical protein
MSPKEEFGGPLGAAGAQVSPPASLRPISQFLATGLLLATVSVSGGIVSVKLVRSPRSIVQSAPLAMRASGTSAANSVASDLDVDVRPDTGAELSLADRRRLLNAYSHHALAGDQETLFDPDDYTGL